ncbi:hypothetical protein [Xanthomonas citri]|uniref:hypothetical protein n=1 Tax=Xanthomonas citri TaxID=346 RepID=UPI00103D813A|nr:hypothetical protein [Xanthomonas citri]MCC8492281.1 hypothetical protein [Xanthomonas citri pv. fuscans]TBW96675.1 hypothetical protein TP49_11665 [Xanthomonas citri pv. aurantifolii]TBX03186.1 hypothetical protein TP46_12155 [Xanthomonas citri pv. aurantifolii]
MANQLAQLSPLDAAAYVQQQGEMGRARGQQNQLAQLASQSYTASPEQQSGILGQMAAIDPRAAQSQQQQFESAEDRRNKTLANMSNLLVNAPEQARAGLYQQMLPTLRQFGVDAPAAYDADTAPVIDQTARALYTAYSGGSAAGGVQSTYVDAQGNRVAILRNGSTQILGQDAPKVQIIDTGDGFYGVNKGTLSAAPVSTGGAPAAQVAGSPMQAAGPGVVSAQGGAADDMQAAELGREFYDQMIQSGLNDQQAMSAVEVYLSRMTRGSGAAPAPGGGQQLRSAPAKITPYQQAQLGMDAQRLALQADANDRAQQQVDRANSPGAKPLPLAAQKTAFDLQDQMQNANNVIDMAQKHIDRLASGQLDVSRTAQAEGWLRSRAGFNDPNSLNLAELDSDKTQIVNESLRLNKGVQTEGDAQRAAREIMAANDGDSLKRSMERMQAINRRALQLKQQQLNQLYSNYGRGADGETAPPRPAEPARAGWSIQRID